MRQLRDGMLTSPRRAYNWAGSITHSCSGPPSSCHWMMVVPFWVDPCSTTQRRADVLLGDIDVRGTRGRQGTNLLLASALIGWRIRLRAIARTPAWRTLEAA
jgi:hypothetical protein